MITTWVAIVFAVVVGGLLIYWHFSRTQVISVDRRSGGNFFDGVSDGGHATHGADGAPGDPGGGDGGAGH